MASVMAVMRVIVCGSRRWPELMLEPLRAQIADRLFDLPTDSVIVHGDAKGVDKIAHQEAQKLGLALEVHPYQSFISKQCSPRRAPLRRNAYMADLGAGLCLAFWDGRSTGTQHMIDQAELRSIPVEKILVGIHTSTPW